MFRSKYLAASLAAAVCLGAAVVGASEPAPHSAVRIEVLRAVEPLIERDVDPFAAITVEEMNVEGDWAYARLTPVMAGGPVDWATARLAASRSTAGMKPWVYVLLRRSGPETWAVLEYLPGATQLPSGEWAARHGAPAGLMPAK